MTDKKPASWNQIQDNLRSALDNWSEITEQSSAQEKNLNGAKEKQKQEIKDLLRVLEEQLKQLE